MIDIDFENLRELAFEDDGDNDYFSLMPEDEAERLIDYYEQKYGFKKIAG
ncbi:MAG: hypothetical protein PHT91_03305 [Candidatus Nanoarchaeia archaeon]|nr:hypothetical protein [Candidatus Nanoarchaeia archaeon]MDD5054368.1 hypothetical protein [Candidatus Nanoarchaeia archaeon]MDD5499876.1 hypothetical protein [Candidatus Nanoarchaeia archaeon]